MAVRVRVQVSGRVQGVGFRWAVEDAARAESVTGWVRNLPDGCVEAVFEGNEEQVQRMVEFCRRGPAAARVENVLASHLTVLELRPFGPSHRPGDSGEFDGFSILQ